MPQDLALLRFGDHGLVVEPQEAGWVKQIFRWYLQTNLGVVAISRELNRLRVKPRRGDRWKGIRICNAQAICDQLAEFVSSFPALSDGERKLVVDSLIREVVLKHKEVAVMLTPPLASLGFLSTGVAPMGIEPIYRLRIILEYTIPGYSEFEPTGEIS